MENMLIKKYWPVVLGTVVGAIAGYLYYQYIGCSGTCMIGAHPLISVAYGAFMGGLAGNLGNQKK